MPAISVDEWQDLDELGQDSIICIRNSIGDILSDPPSSKWNIKPGASANRMSAEEIIISAIIGQTIEVC